MYPDNISQMNYLHKNIRNIEITNDAKIYKFTCKCHSQATGNVYLLLIIKPATMTQIAIYLYIHTYIHTSIHTYIHTSIHTYIIYIYASYIYIYTHIIYYIHNTALKIKILLVPVN